MCTLVYIAILEVYPIKPVMSFVGGCILNEHTMSSNHLGLVANPCQPTVCTLNVGGGEYGWMVYIQQQYFWKEECFLYHSMPKQTLYDE